MGAGEVLALEARVRACTQCAISATSQTRSTWRPMSNLREGVDVVFVGEAPGSVEDTCSLPFVGPSGQLLQKWIPLLGLREDQYIITNSVRCWPRVPGSDKSRPPTKKERVNCAPFLREFLALTKPRIVIAVGSSAKRALDELGVEHLHVHHPAYYLRGHAWEKDVEKLRLALQAKLAMSYGPNGGKVEEDP